MVDLNKTTGQLMNNDRYVGSSVIFPFKEIFFCITAGHNIFGKDFDETPNFDDWKIIDYLSKSHTISECLVSKDFAKEHDIVILKLKCNSNLDSFDLPHFYSISKNPSHSFFFQGKNENSDNLVTHRKIYFCDIDKKNKFKFWCSIDKNLLTNSSFKSGSDWLGGWSGSGLFLDNHNELICFGIMIEIPEKGDHGQLKFISISALENLDIDLQIQNSDEIKKSTNIDIWASEKYSELQIDDKRNLLEKLKNANGEITDRKINSYSRQLANGKIELNNLIPSRELSAIKYRVFHKCQTVLVDFIDSIEKAGKDSLSNDEIKQLIEDYTNNGMEIMKKKSNSFSYPYLDEDLMEKLILDLINDCYLSFDEKGIYENN